MIYQDGFSLHMVNELVVVDYVPYGLFYFHMFLTQNVVCFRQKQQILQLHARIRENELRAQQVLQSHRGCFEDPYTLNSKVMLGYIVLKCDGRLTQFDWTLNHRMCLSNRSQ